MEEHKFIFKSNRVKCKEKKIHFSDGAACLQKLEKLNKTVFTQNLFWDRSRTAVLCHLTWEVTV
jgi:hypothetical protein